jgi:hypothetical protein
MADHPREQSRSGCGAALAWFVAVGLIRAIGRELGWSDRTQVIAVVAALVLVVIVMAARQQPVVRSSATVGGQLPRTPSPAPQDDRPIRGHSAMISVEYERPTNDFKGGWFARCTAHRWASGPHWTKEQADGAADVHALELDEEADRQRDE